MATTVFDSIRREEEEKLARKRHLQRLMHDDSKSIIERTKARVELAILTSDAAVRDDDFNIDDAFKRGATNTGVVVSCIAAEREREIQRHMERQREESMLCLIAQLKEHGALMSEARKLRLEKELEQAVEQWEIEESSKGEGVVEDALVQVAKKALSTRPIIPRSEETKDVSFFQEQLDLFRDHQQRQQQVSSSSSSSTGIKLPPSFYKSSPSSVGGIAPGEHPQGQGEEEKNKIVFTHGSKEISDGWEMRQTLDSWQTQNTEDTSSVISDCTTSTVEINNASVGLAGNALNRTESLERQVQMLLKEAELREESMQMMAMELECSERRVARIAQEKAEIQAELDEMHLLLAEASAKAQKKEERGERKKSTKSSKLIYQVSCRKCPKGKNCSVVGVTIEDLKSKVLILAKQSITVAVASGEKKKTGLLDSSFNIGGRLNSSNCSVGESSRLTEEITNEDAFIQHLASHIPKEVAKNEKEALSFCKKIVKVEVLKKESGEELYWQDSIDE